MGRLRPDRLREAGVKLPGDLFIETGTCSGNGVRSVVHLFKESHSIEIDEQMFRNARRKVSRFGIKFHLGNSPDVLRKIIDPSRETVFWLDSHFVKGFGEQSVSSAKQCPLLEELESIFSFDWRTPPMILIDDAEFFGNRFWKFHRSRGYRRADWPTFDKIKQSAESNGMTMRVIKNTVLVAKE